MNNIPFITKVVLEVINDRRPIQFNIGGWLYNTAKQEYPNYHFEETDLLTVVNNAITWQQIPYKKVGEKTFVLVGHKFKLNGCSPYNKYTFESKDKADKTKKFWLIIDTNLKGYFTTNEEAEALTELSRLVNETGREYLLIVSVGIASPTLPTIKYERY